MRPANYRRISGGGRQLENPDFEQLVSRIQAGEDAAMEDLYKLLNGGIRYLVCRQLGPQDIDDKINDIFLIVVEAIRRGDLREPARLMGFVRTVVRRQIAGYIETAVAARSTTVPLDTDAPAHSAEMRQQVRVWNTMADRKHNPEQALALKEKAALIKAALDEMRPRDREILTRFYLDEIPWRQICEEMNLSPQQFRLLKNRAKGKFGEIGKDIIRRNELQLIRLRHSITEKKAA